MTEASELDMTVNCDAFAGDCDYLTIRRGESGEDDTCSYENYYDMAITMNDCYDIGGLGVAFVSMSCEVRCGVLLLLSLSMLIAHGVVLYRVPSAHGDACKSLWNQY